MRDSISAQFTQNPRVIVAWSLDEPAADRASGRINARNRAVLELRTLGKGIGRFTHLNVLAMPPPFKSGCSVRMNTATRQSGIGHASS
jgi:hypothetical protein